MAKVTYVLLNEGDPIKTKFNGHVFKAHEPREVSDNAVIAFDAGKSRNFLEALRENPHFEVEGDKKKGKTALAALPANSDQYKRHAINWINAYDADDGYEPFAKRWASEERLREACGCGEDDIDIIMKFFTPKHDALKAAEAAQ